jgi:hypothetical protein
MDDALLVRRCETAGDLDADLDRLAWCDSAVDEALSQGFTVEQLGHQVCGAVVGADVVNREDIWMRQGGDRAGFTFEPRAAVLILRDLDRKNLDRDVAIEPGVVRPIHLTHSARADGLRDEIWPEQDP